MSFLKKIAKNKNNKPGKDVPPKPPIVHVPPDQRVMRDEGIGGYLNDSQLNDFVNPRSPSNIAGQRNMADLMQQQRDTFGGMLNYGTPPSDDTPPPPPPPDDTPPPGKYPPPDKYPPPGKYPPFEDDIRVPPPDLNRPPYGPPSIPPFDLPGGSGQITSQVIVYGPDGTQYSSPAAALAAGVTNYTMTPPNSGITGLPLPIDVPGQQPISIGGPGGGITSVEPPPYEPPSIPPFDLPTPRDEQIFVPPRVPNIPPREDRIPMVPPSIPNIPPREDRIPMVPPSIPNIPPRDEELVTIPSEDFLTGGLPSVNLPPSIPVPRLPTGMETLVSPDIFINRNRNRRLR
jgi:hypothetical protein